MWVALRPINLVCGEDLKDILGKAVTLDVWSLVNLASITFCWLGFDLVYKFCRCVSLRPNECNMSSWPGILSYIYNPINLLIGSHQYPQSLLIYLSIDNSDIEAEILFIGWFRYAGTNIIQLLRSFTSKKLWILSSSNYGNIWGKHTG